jgi:hypothetical protein
LATNSDRKACNTTPARAGFKDKFIGKTALPNYNVGLFRQERQQNLRFRPQGDTMSPPATSPQGLHSK